MITSALLLLVIAAPGEAPPWLAAPSFEPRWLSASRPATTPRRIVTVAPSVTELVFALGGGDRVVGVSRYDDHPPEARALPKVGGFLDPSAEAILALKPELVIAAPSSSNRGVLDRIAALGVPVLVVPGNGLSDLFHALEAIGPVLGAPGAKKSAELVQHLRRELEALRASVHGRSKPRVAFVYDRNPLVLAGPGSFADTLLVLLGAENVVRTKVEYPSYSREQLLLDRPDVVIDASLIHWLDTATTARPGVLQPLVLEVDDPLGGYWAKWRSLPAVESGRVYGVIGTALLRPAPRLIGAMRELASRLHQGPESPTSK